MDYWPFLASMDVELSWENNTKVKLCRWLHQIGLWSMLQVSKKRHLVISHRNICRANCDRIRNFTGCISEWYSFFFYLMDILWFDLFLGFNSYFPVWYRTVLAIDALVLFTWLWTAYLDDKERMIWIINWNSWRVISRNIIKVKILITLIVEISKSTCY